MRVLVVNAGSATLKLRVVDADDAVAGHADLPAVGVAGHDDITRALAALRPFDAIGHRVVHGGEAFRGPVVVDDEVRRRLGDLTALAPLHQPKSLAALDVVGAVAPGVLSVACFDTAFHATLPPEAATYAVPAEWRDGLGVRRYGFHGLSHAHAARRSAEMTAAPGAPAERVVTCHLGAGASLAAVRDGRSVDTTMGFTPLEGLTMATRSGSVDPGAVLWLLTEQGMPAGEVSDALEHRSGLAALAGTPDMAAVVDRAGAGDEAAGLALAVYLHRLRAGVAAMAASLGGLDVLTFTGGVGENAPAVRAGAAAGLAFLGVEVDGAANDAVDVATRPDADITAVGATVRTLVVAAREDVEIARGVRALLG
ncbi:MAG TPA: acetate/propionate family kinase [Acidimicrobiales bacterium]